MKLKPSREEMAERDAYARVVKGVLKDFLGLKPDDCVPVGIVESIKNCSTVGELSLFRRRVLDEIFRDGIQRVKDKYKEKR